MLKEKEKEKKEKGRYIVIGDKTWGIVNDLDTQVWCTYIRNVYIFIFLYKNESRILKNGMNLRLTNFIQQTQKQITCTLYIHTHTNTPLFYFL